MPTSSYPTRKLLITKTSKTDSLTFLLNRYLARDKFEDAKSPYPDKPDAEASYGKSINALELVSGWRVKRLLWTTLVAVILDICIVAIVILLTKSGEMALAAGSYAAAIEALVMGLITLLSAVLP